MARKKTGAKATSGKKSSRSRAKKGASSAAPARPRLCTVQKPDAAGRLIPEKGHYAAQEDLKKILGGHRAMLADPELTRRRKGPHNLMGLAVGARECNGHLTGELAIKVFVRKKVARSRVEAAALVPPRINGYPTDVEEIGEIRALSAGAGGPLPIPCGEPIANERGVEEGTLGCLVVTDGQQCLLSCNHVIANLNDAEVGDTVLFHDSQTGARLPIAQLLKWSTLELDNESMVNMVDAAVARLLPDSVSHKLLKIPLASPPRDAAVFDNVTKYGCTTGVTLGIVDCVNAEIPVTFEGRIGDVTVDRTGLFEGQVRIRSMGAPFCDSGDSGSMVLLVGTNQPVGLLFAGDVSQGFFANPIRAVVNTLRITGLPALSPA
jgi:hypothetical protein